MPIDEERRGPATRSWAFARVLSSEHEVTLLVPNEGHPSHPDFTVCTCQEGELDGLLAGQEVVVIQGPALQTYPRLGKILAEGRHKLVVDLYDPITLEQLAVDTQGQVGPWLHLEYWALLNEQLKLGDFFLCANERQRDYWLGALAALGRLNHDTWDGSDFRRLIDLVPFGLPADAPQPAPAILRGRVPGIAAGDQIILWGGGLWDWLDPLTPVRAMKTVAAQCPRARLVFFQLASGWMSMWDQTRKLAEALGLLDQQVIFADWLSPEEWAACLLEADVGLSFHPAGIETHFAFRTRLLDYIWAGLPIVTASGDVLSELVEPHGLGYVVEPGDPETLAQALISLLQEPDARGSRRASFQDVAQKRTWERAVEPLARYCDRPWRAGDAGPSFVKRWKAAQRDRILSDTAHAHRWRIEAENYARALEKELAKAKQRAMQLEGELGTLGKELEQSEARFQAAMNGRVMRLMTGMQEALRRWRDQGE
jgi:glycosyltransferase involved in cell wall biosynthesis